MRKYKIKLVNPKYSGLVLIWSIPWDKDENTLYITFFVVVSLSILKVFQGQAISDVTD